MNSGQWIVSRTSLGNEIGALCLRASESRVFHLFCSFRLSPYLGSGAWQAASRRCHSHFWPVAQDVLPSGRTTPGRLKEVRV